MIKHIATVLFFLFVWSASRGQQEGMKLREEKAPAAVSDTSREGLDVLFATNDDCELYINDEAKGPVSKTAFRFLKLPAGTYRYKAKSKSTGDELTDVFTVVAGESNEVFMDLLYVIDEKAAQRAGLRGGAFTTDTLAQRSRKLAVGKSPKTAKPTKEEAQKETLLYLVSNVVPMKGGNFTMGNNRAPSHDETEHTVTLNPFYFSKFEITQYQWESVMGYNPSINKDCETCPVENVSWEEANLFIEKLNSLSNRKFRLPTEAEWEYVARLGGKAEIDKAGSQEAYIKNTAWYFSNADTKTHPVGRKEPNTAGVYDLTGNVSEWCSDWYSPTFYKEAGSRKNPTGPAKGKEKVVRGGNFKDYVGDRFRPSFRNKRLPSGKSNELGFRIVLDVSE